jgi:hypothetical protein
MLSNMRSKAELPTRLQLFQDVRCKRASAIQIISKAGVDHVEMIAEEVKAWMQPVPRKLAN